MLIKTHWREVLGLLITLIVIREVAVIIMTAIGHPKLANFVGLFVLWSMLMVYKRVRSISPRFLVANNLLMKESALAYLPYVAGSLTVMSWFSHSDLIKFCVVITVSTLIPLWVYARWFKQMIPSQPIQTDTDECGA